MSDIESIPNNKSRKRQRSSSANEDKSNSKMEKKEVLGMCQGNWSGNDNYDETSCNNGGSKWNDKTSSTVKQPSEDDRKPHYNKVKDNMNSERSKPNASLTTDERKEKQKLKKRLKMLTKINKLETRIRHAISRKDEIVEEKARHDLNLLLQQMDPDTDASNNIGEKESGSSTMFDEEKERQKIASDRESVVKNEIIFIANELFCFAKNSNCNVYASKDEESIENVNNYCGQNNGSEIDTAIGQKATSPSLAVNSKRIQTEKAVKLLKHFTKGTQSHNMFRDHNALWGYTRQKFTERATLVYKSLSKLQPLRKNHPNNQDDNPSLHPIINKQLSDKVPPRHLTSNPMPIDEHDLKTKAWKKLKEIKYACSIGCGPGNDAVGLLAFLCHNNRNMNNIAKETNFLLLDWAISDWEDAILNHLHYVLEKNTWTSTKKYNSNNHNYVSNENGVNIDNDLSMKFAFCDVTKSFHSEQNKEVFIKNMNRDHTTNEINESYTRSLSETKIKDIHEGKRKMHFDIYLTSYLISETRGKWEPFYRDLIFFAKAGALFYFAEPTPWQLHRLCELCDDLLDFLWIDSSMCHPELQKLDRRVGPAVLLGVRKK